MSSNQTPPTREEIIHAIAILGVHAEVLDAIRGVHGDGALRTLQRFAFGLCCGELAIGNTQRCDCGAALTSCHDCAVGDYQAAHPACKDCCPPTAQMKWFVEIKVGDTFCFEHDSERVIYRKTGDREYVLAAPAVKRIGSRGAPVVLVSPETP